MSAPVTSTRTRSLPTRRLLAAIGAACVLLSSVTGVAAAAQAVESPIVLDRHHTDAVSVRYEGDELVLKTRADLDSGAGQVLDPADVLFRVTDDLQDAVPDLAAFTFLGEPGAPIWKISQTYAPGVLWAGWETESLPRGVFVGDRVRLELQEITGPGDVELYLNDIDGPRRLLSSTDPELRTITENVGAHVHANWVFTEPGDYRFTFIGEADLVAGGSIRSESQTYAFLVGPDAEPEPAPTENPEPSPSPSDTDAPIPQPTDSTDPADPTPEPEPSTSPEPEADPAPEPVDPTVVPANPLPAPDAASLTEENRGELTLSTQTVAPGSQVAVTIPASHASHWVSPWLLSDPVDLGWKQVNAEGGFTVALPPDAVTGEHRLVVRDHADALIGWAEIEVVAAGQAEEVCVSTPVTSTAGSGNVDVATDGHFDFGPVKEGSAVRALLKDDRQAPAQWKDPGAIVFHLGDSATAQAPGGQFDFLGSGQVWQVPLTQQAGVPWVGWNTQHPSIAGKTHGPITLTLDNLEGPGDLAVYSVNSWGQLGEKYFGTVSGFPRSTSIEVGASGVHVHGIWAFTQPGAYYATLTFSGTIDGAQSSGTSTLTFFVGDGDPSSAAREQSVTTYVGRTASGAECQLSLAATGPADAEFTADLAGLAGATLLVGLAFLGASALAPRRRGARTTTA